MESESTSSNVQLTKPFLDTVDQDDTETLGILEEKSKSKPYNAIMYILLYVWTKDRRRLVTKELQELRKVRKQDLDGPIPFEELSRHTLLIWKDLNVGNYYEYINRHKSYVTKGFEYFNELIVSIVKPRLYQEGLLPDTYHPDADPDSDQIAEHDNSKYSFVESVTYAMKWYPLDGLKPACDEDAWETGLRHHYCHNEHHPEFWGCKPMEWRYIVEAVYDMAAMELEKKFGGQEPDNKALLLVFNTKFLTRFNKTHQLEFLLKLCQYTIEAYCKSTGCRLPEATNSSP